MLRLRFVTITQGSKVVIVIVFCFIDTFCNQPILTMNATWTWSSIKALGSIDQYPTTFCKSRDAYFYKNSKQASIQLI